MTTTLTPQQFIQLEKNAGFPQNQWAFGLATAQVESGLQPSVINPSTGAAGLFQVLPSHLKEPGIKGPLINAQQNVDDAFILWKQSGWEPWQCHGCEPPGAAQERLAWAQEQVSRFTGNASSNWTVYALVGGAILLLILLVRG